MKQIILALAVTTAGIAGQSATQQTDPALPARISTIAHYIEICEKTDTVHQAACLGYTRGLISGIVAGQYLVQNNRGEKASEEVFCPRTITDASARDLLLNALKTGAPDRSKFMYAAGARILSKALPCPKKET